MFKEWDRVFYNCPEEGLVNKKATVLGFNGIYRLRMDSMKDCFHNCFGKCKEGHGKYAVELELTLITNKPA